MTPVKRFFLIYFAVYLVVGLAINFIYGPPGLSSEYLQQGTNQADHERYLSVVKSDDYKLWKERPNLHEPPAGVDFVAEYEQRPAFQAEDRRRATYTLLMETWNFLMVTYLIVHFARKPLGGFLDEQIDVIRQKLQAGEAARTEATERYEHAQQKYDSIGDEIAEEERYKVAQIQREREEIEQLTADNLAEIDRATEDRKREEEHLAVLRVKEELVNEAIAAVTEQIKKAPAAADDAELISQFVEELEKRR